MQNLLMSYLKNKMYPEDLKWIYDNILWINCTQFGAGYIQITYFDNKFNCLQIMRTSNGLSKDTCYEYLNLIHQLINK